MNTQPGIGPLRPQADPQAGATLASAGPPAGPVRVLHVYRRFHPDYTGDGIYYTKLIPHLAERGIANEVLAYETRTPDGAASAVHENVRIHYLGNRRLRGAAGLLAWMAANLRRYDVVHLHAHVDRLFLSYALARVAGRPVLFSCTLDDSPTQLIAGYRRHNRPLVAAIMPVISAFVTISPHLLRRALETTPMERLRFIPQGIALAERAPPDAARAEARRRLGLGAEDFVLLNCGSVSRRKNVAFLVEALARIPAPAVKLVIVGPQLEPDYLAELDARIAEADLGGRVLFTGFQADPAPWYAAADAFVFASTAEGFPNVYLEAMVASLPIVTLFLPGLTDFIVDHGRSGFLAGDMEQFVGAIEQLRADPGLRAEMGEASRRFAERNLGIGTVAARYAGLYREVLHGAPRGGAASAAPRGGAASADPRGGAASANPRGEAAKAPRGEAATDASRGTAMRDRLPDLDIRFTARLAEGPASIGLEEFDLPPGSQPLLQVVVDTEADFDWHKGIWTDVGQVSSLAALEERFDVFRRHGVLPALVVDHPVATQDLGRHIVRRLAAEGCEVGVHLHPWTTPPIVEIKDDWHSFGGNLGARLESAKLAILCRQVEELIGRPPRVFKAGRYGLGPNTVAAIEELGFDIDLSICPLYDYGALGGPDFTRFTSRPGWFGRDRRLLSLPTTAGPLGWLDMPPEWILRVLRSDHGRRFGLERIAGQLRAFRPARLSPEGCSLADMQRLTRRLHAAGHRVFTLSFHSPTLQVGNTPYVRSPEELGQLLASIDGYLAFFRDELGGAFATPSGLYGMLSAASPRSS